jgi:hypothetical protein
MLYIKNILSYKSVVTASRRTVSMISNKYDFVFDMAGNHAHNVPNGRNLSVNYRHDLVRWNV